MQKRNEKHCQKGNFIIPTLKNRMKTSYAMTLLNEGIVPKKCLQAYFENLTYRRIFKKAQNFSFFLLIFSLLTGQVYCFYVRFL